MEKLPFRRRLGKAFAVRCHDVYQVDKRIQKQIQLVRFLYRYFPLVLSTALLAAIWALVGFHVYTALLTIFVASNCQ